MLILAEGGKIPVDNPAGHFELAMIDESKGLEYSGRGAALMKWGGQMKFLVLTCIFLNVLLAPWGLADGQQLRHVLLAIPFILIKVLVFVVVLVMIESSLAKLRLFRISEFLGAGRIHHFRGGDDRQHLFRFGCVGRRTRDERYTVVAGGGAKRPSRRANSDLGLRDGSDSSDAGGDAFLHSAICPAGHFLVLDWV